MHHHYLVYQSQIVDHVYISAVISSNKKWLTGFEGYIQKLYLICEMNLFKIGPIIFWLNQETLM